MGTECGTATGSPRGLAKVAWKEKWQDGDHIRLLDDYLVRLARRDFDRLMVWMPPRHGKSTLISQFLVPWYLGHHPDHRVIMVGYGHEFTKTWSRKARDIAREFLPKFWNLKLREDVWAASEWELEGRAGGVLATGSYGQIMGRGADLLIIDDPIKGHAEAVSEVHRQKVWDMWQSAARVRLEPNGIVVIVQTRWHTDDLSGRILSEPGGDEFTVLSLPAIAQEPGDALGREPGDALWPERYDRGDLERIKKGMSNYLWQALFQQVPTKHESVLWPAEYFEGDHIRFVDWPRDLQVKAMALDPSKGGSGTKAGDYSAYVMLGVDSRANFYIEADMSQTRAAKQIVDDGVRLFRTFSPDIFGVEANAFQDLFLPMFSDAFGGSGLLRRMPIAIKNTISKRLRIETLDEWLSQGLVKFRMGRGTDILINQLREYPQGLHDDGPDAMEMAVRLAGKRIGVRTQHERTAGVMG